MNYTTTKRKNGKGIKIQFELTEEQIFISKLKKGDKIDFSKDGLNFCEARVTDIFEWRQKNQIRIMVRPLIENWREKYGIYGFTYRDFTRYHGIPNAMISQLHSCTRNWRSELKVFDFIDFVIPKYIQELFTSKLEINFCYSGMIIAKTSNYIYVSATIPHLCGNWDNKIHFYKNSFGVFIIPFTIGSDDIFKNETITKMKVKPCCGVDRNNRLVANHCCFNRKYLDPELISGFIRTLSYKTLFVDFDSKFVDNSTACPICFEELSLTKLGCGHKCCEECFHKMFMHSHCYMENSKIECPLCRKNIFKLSSAGPACKIDTSTPIVGIDGKYNEKYLDVIFNNCKVRDKDGILYQVISRENISEQIKKDTILALKKCEISVNNDNGCIFKKKSEIEVVDNYNISVIHFRNPKVGAYTVDLKKASRHQTHLIKKRIKDLSEVEGAGTRCNRENCSCAKNKKPFVKCFKTLNGTCNRYKPHWDNFILYLTDYYSLDESKFHMTILTKFLKKYYPYYIISYEGTKCHNQPEK